MMTDDGYRNRKFAPAYVPAPKQIVARFASKCADCGAVIEAGETVLWTPGQYKARVTHVACPKPEPVAPVVEAPVVEALAFTGDPETDLGLAARTLSDADLETTLRASEAGSTVERILLAELDRRMEASSAPAPVAMCEHCLVRPAGPRGHCGHRFCVEANDWARISASEVAKARRQAAEVAPAPVAPVAPAGPARLAVEDAGVYVLPDGSVCRVKANREKTRTYASRWTATHQDRLMGDGQHAHGEYVYEAGLVALVAAQGRKMTLAEAKAHSVKYGTCIRCGRALKDGKSVEQGMGPVCVKYFQGA